jgi:hypothetical protein
MKIAEQKTIIINTIMINGNIRGLFCSNVDWFKLGSKRSLVELVLGEYHAEVDIDIVSHHIDSLPFISE